MNDSESNGRRGRSRRSFLAAAGSGVAAGVALSGCTQLDDVASGDDGDAQDDPDDDDDDGDGNGDGVVGANTGTPTDTPLTTTATATETARTTATTSTTTTNATTDEGEAGNSDERDLRLVESAVTTLDPVAAVDAASESVLHQLFEGLTTHPNGEAAIRSALAKDISVSDDFRTFTFQLREGVEFHDGSELTADDVVYSFERLAASKHAELSSFLLSNGLDVEHETDADGTYVPGSLAVEATDEYTFRFRLVQPFAPALDVLADSALSVVPRGIVDDVDVMPAGSMDDDETTAVDGEFGHDEFAKEKPVGTGPFEFDSWNPGTDVRVERFDEYHSSPAEVAGVHWQIIEDPERVYAHSMNRNADFVTMPTAKYDPGKVDVEGTDDLGRRYGTYGPMANGRIAQYLEVATLNTYYVGFNCENVDKPVRQAVAYVMDEQHAANRVFRGRGTAAYHLTPPNIYPGGVREYDDHAEGSYPYGYGDTQFAEAKRVMEDAGYGPNDKYELTFTTFPSAAWQGLGKILRDKLVSAHVAVTLEELPVAELMERGRRGDLDAYAMRTVADWPAPNNVLGQVVPDRTDTDEAGGASGFYLNWDVDASDAARRATTAWQTVVDNPEPTESAKRARDEAYAAIEEATWEDVPLLPVYHETAQRLWYDWVDVPYFGGLGAERQTYDDVVVSERDA